VSAGNLRHLVTLEIPSATPDGAGGQSMVWQTLVQVWAEITPLAAEEITSADQVEARATHRIRIRWRSDVTAAMRVRLGARLFAIRGVTDQGERGRYLVLLCEEGAPA
jgi:SPP1 family predicted phage head-tail adaptor